MSNDIRSILDRLTTVEEGKLTPVEKDMKNREKQQYILSKIKNYQEAKQRAQQELITGLPHWDTEYDVIHRKINL